MRVLVTGAAGQLGCDVLKELKKRAHIGIGSDLADSVDGAEEYIRMDITDKEEVEQVISQAAADAVIHCAAWTAVDAAEDEENRDKVYRINADGTKNIADACRKNDCKLLYLSTDYVFDGQGEDPWQEDCKAYRPLSVYGDSKLEGEKAVASLEKSFIVRIAWVFGINGQNFVRTMLKVGENHDRLTVVSDQIGTPTYTADLARLLVDMIETDKYGYYHATNEGGYISWYEFAKEIFAQAQAMGHSEYDEAHLTLVPVTTEEYGVSKANRPKNSRLSKDKLRDNGFEPLPDWKDALHRYLLEVL